MISAGEMSNLLVWMSAACQQTWFSGLFAIAVDYLPLQCYHRRDEGAPLFRHLEIPVSHWLLAGLSVEAIGSPGYFFFCALKL